MAFLEIVDNLEYFHDQYRQLDFSVLLSNPKYKVEIHAQVKYFCLAFQNSLRR